MVIMKAQPDLDSMLCMSVSAASRLSTSQATMSALERSASELYDPTALIVCIAVIGLIIAAIAFWGLQTYLRRRRASSPVSEKV